MKIKEEMKKWKNFVIFSVILFIFFVLSQFHDWANEFFIKLHFCNHTFCMIFSIIWAGFAFFAWQKKKSYINIALIVLIIGIVFMNMTYCDINGNIFLGNFSLYSFEKDETTPIPIPGESITVPIPPCKDTDAGRDYITPGMILSGANIEDICMGNILRERYCDSDTTYTSEDIDCKAYYGEGWICEDGECIESEEPYIPEEEKEDTLELCTDELDNDGDGATDCADSDCAEYCECAHDCDPLTGCFGYCNWEIYGYEGYCAVYNTLGADWCECVPNGEIPCGEVDGWCRDGDMCVPTPDGNYICVYDYGYPCYESDGGMMPTVGGYCYDINDGVFYYDECEKFNPIVMEMWCTDLGCTTAQGWCEDWGYECLLGYGEGDYCGVGEF